MTLPATTHIRLRLDAGVMHLTLDDPATMNALSGALVAEVELAFAAAEAAACRALVVRGSGPAFSAGGDVKAMLSALANPPRPGEADPIEMLNAAGGAFFKRYAGLPFATIAVVDGMAAGGGFGLAAASDFVIAGPKARFALTETGLGLVPAQIAPYLADRLGRRAALRLALTGRRLDAAAAAALGLADVAADDAEAAVTALLGELRGAAPGASTATKRLFGDLDTDDFVRQAARTFAAAVRGPEAGEGIAAFFAKRKPRWAEET